MTERRTRSTSEPELDAPVLVVMLLGWIDAGGAAAAAMTRARDRDWRPAPIATFDARHVHRLPRPAARRWSSATASTPRLVWPDIELQAGRDARRPRRAAPHRPRARRRLATRSPTRSTDLAVDLGARMMVGLGAYPFATPHTRPPRLSMQRQPSPSSPTRCRTSATRSTCRPAWRPRSSTRFADDGLPAVGLWAQVPHYVSSVPLPGGVGGAARRAARRRPASTSRRRPLRSEALHPAPAASTSWWPATTSTSTMVAPARAAPTTPGASEPTDRTAGDACRRADAAVGRRAGRRARALPRDQGDVSTVTPRRRRDATATVRAMKVDGGIGTDLTKAGGQAKERGGGGLRGHLDGRDQPRPVLPAAARGRAHRAGRARHVDRRGLRPQPDDLANIGWDLQAFSKGRFILGLGSQIKPHITKRFSHAVEPPGAAHAGDDPGHPGHLGLLEQRHASSTSAATSTPTR